MKRRQLILREGGRPTRWMIGYWDGSTAYPDRDFRVVRECDPDHTLAWARDVELPDVLRHHPEYQ